LTLGIDRRARPWSAACRPGPLSSVVGNLCTRLGPFHFGVPSAAVPRTDGAAAPCGLSPTRAAVHPFSVAQDCWGAVGVSSTFAADLLDDALQVIHVFVDPGGYRLVSAASLGGPQRRSDREQLPDDVVTQDAPGSLPTFSSCLAWSCLASVFLA